ncbi:S-adenosyl-L-methionine-dependent methyltransferase [Aspergillus unguis]
MSLTNGVTRSPKALIAKLHQISSRLDEDDDDARNECLQLSQALTIEMESPENRAIDLAFWPMISSSARIAIELNLFEYIVQHGPVAAKTLSALSGGEELLIVRILRLLSPGHFVEETAPKTWKAAPVTEALASKEIAAGHRTISHTVTPAMTNAHAFFRSQGHLSSVTDPTNGLIQFALGTELSCFEYMATQPTLLKDFNLYMGNGLGSRKSWLDWFPVQERILDGVEAPVVVDVGGGKGHDLVAFSQRFPSIGTLVLEDLSPVIEGLEFNGIDKVAYDFFTEQPVTGARVYIYHHILHDWSDEHCLEILNRVVSAMTPGYSKLLILDMILPDQGASLFHAQMDIAMMAFNGGMERTKEQWQVLLERAGLCITEIWDAVDEGGDGIIEAVRCCSV